MGYKCVIEIHTLLLKLLACHIVILMYSTWKMTSSTDSSVTKQSFMLAVNFTAPKIHTSAVFVTATADQHNTF